MTEDNDNLREQHSVLQSTADILFAYLRDVIYDSHNAVLDIAQLPREFEDLGKGLQFFANLVFETTALAKELSNGNLHCELPSPSNEIAAPLKMLHASLKHLTWQTQQVAKGDYKQHVEFMGDFSLAFNNMIKQLEQRWQISLDEKSRLELYVDLMLANCPDPVLLFDRQGCLAYVSNSYLHCTELTSVDNILGKQARDLLAPVVSQEAVNMLEAMFATAVQEKRTVAINEDMDFGHNGHSRHYQIQVSPMLNSEGEDMGVMVLLNDTTEIVRARREAERARELAERSSRAKSDFLARMSHEMRTPMNAILGMTAICKATTDQQRQEYGLNKIEEAAQHLLGVINDVLDMSNMETDNFVLSYATCDMHKLLDQVVKAIAFRVEERQQQLDVHIDPALPALAITDGKRLTQVLNNLLSNAVKFSADGGSISLSVELTAQDGQACRLRFTVADNGVGIDEEQQQHIFVPFEQAEGGLARKFGGTGLGLAISQHIVRMLGGNIQIDSAKGIGSTFSFEIPLQIPEASCEVNGQVTIYEEGMFSGYRLLMVEDVALNREIILALLEDTGIEIESAEDGLIALEKFVLSPEKYDIILMDIHMPNLDGYETTRRIRASGLPKADTVPIIAMTANVFREDIEKCLECGMNGHLGKPVDLGELLAKFKEYLKPVKREQ